MKAFLLLLFCSSCSGDPSICLSTNYSVSTPDTLQIVPEATTIATRFKLPPGYTRMNTASDSQYTRYLRNLRLKPAGSEVHLYNGSLKNRQDVHAAVLDIPVGPKDLQQCADAVMRVRADYLYERGRFEELSFNFTNGFPASYARWREGYAIEVQGNKCVWARSGNADRSEQSYLRYLYTVFNYAGSLSLSRQMHAVDDIKDIEPGDVWIRGGSPGHAVFVVDVARNEKGEKIFLLAQSYMPAQEIHVLKNFNEPGLSPWYSVKGIGEELETPEYTFTTFELKRF